MTSRIGRYHTEQRIREVLDRILDGSGSTVTDDGIDHEPDPPARWDEDRALARMEDAYEREIERNHP